MTDSSKHERVTEEFDAEGNLKKRIITVDTIAQASIELNFDRSGKPAPKVKVYEDDPETMDKRLEEFVKIAEKHSGIKLTP